MEGESLSREELLFQVLKSDVAAVKKVVHPFSPATRVLRPVDTKGYRLRSGKKYHARATMWKTQGGLCAYCDDPLETPDHGTLDHVIPKAKGGSNLKGNLRLVCAPCNALKAWFSSLEEVEEFSAKLLSFFRKLREKKIL